MRNLILFINLAGESHYFHSTATNYNQIAYKEQRKEAAKRKFSQFEKPETSLAQAIKIFSNIANNPAFLQISTHLYLSPFNQLLPHCPITFSWIFQDHFSPQLIFSCMCHSIPPYIDLKRSYNLQASCPSTGSRYRSSIKIKLLIEFVC